MGLLTSYSDYNKVTNTALNVQYAVTTDKYEYAGWEVPIDSHGPVSSWMQYEKPYYRVTRYATKSYSYVGMDYATAVNCQNAKIAQYTRPYSRAVEVKVPYHDPVMGINVGQKTVLSTEYTYECRSDIVASHVDGCMWRVDINVNEEDEKASYTLPQDPASLFTAENQRNYDEVAPTTSSDWGIGVELSDDGYL